MCKGYVENKNNRGVNKYCTSFIQVSSTAPIAEWLEGHAGKQGVAGSIPGGGILYRFEFLAYIPLITSRRRPYK